MAHVLINTSVLRVVFASRRSWLPKFEREVHREAEALAEKACFTNVSSIVRRSGVGKHCGRTTWQRWSPPADQVHFRFWPSCVCRGAKELLHLAQYSVGLSAAMQSQSHEEKSARLPLLSSAAATANLVAIYSYLDI